MFVLPPLRRLFYFRQDERRVDRLEHFGAVKRMGRSEAETDYVGEIFAGAPFGHDPRDQLRARKRDADELDLGKLFLKLFQVIVAAAAGIDHLAFLLGGLERALPFGLPIVLGVDWVVKNRTDPTVSKSKTNSCCLIIIEGFRTLDVSREITFAPRRSRRTRGFG